MLHDDLGPEWVTEIKGYKNGVGVCQLPGDPIRKFRAGLLADEATSVRVWNLIRCLSCSRSVFWAR